MKWLATWENIFIVIYYLHIPNSNPSAMHNLIIICHVIIGHNIPFPFKMNLFPQDSYIYIYIYMKTQHRILKCWMIGVLFLKKKVLNHLCEHLKQKSLASHILEFIRNNKLNVWNRGRLIQNHNISWVYPFHFVDPLIFKLKFHSKCILQNFKLMNC